MTYWQLKKMRRQQANQIKNGFFIPTAPINTNVGLDNSEVVDESDVVGKSEIVLGDEKSVKELEKVEVPTDNSVETEVGTDTEQVSSEITEPKEETEKSVPPKATRRKAKPAKSE